MRTRRYADLPESSYRRTFQVDYYQLTDDIWQIRCQLRDPMYSMLLALDISVADMIVRDSNLDLLNFPHAECGQLTTKVKVLIGSELREGIRTVLREHFTGSGGCENIFNMVSVSCRHFPFMYGPWAANNNKVSLEEAEILKGDSNCVAFPAS